MFPKFNPKKDVIKSSLSKNVDTVKKCQDACVKENGCKNFMFRVLKDKEKPVCHLFNKDEMEIEKVNDNYRYTFTGPKVCPEEVNDCAAYDIEA